jgi:hypothetical protein
VNRLVRGVGIVAWVWLFLPAIAAAQDVDEGRASLFDLGVYAGGTYHTDWFTTPGIDGDDVGWGPGITPVFGAQATYWFAPGYGGRLHAAYLPTDFAPEGFDADGVDILLVDAAFALRALHPDYDAFYIPRSTQGFGGLGLIHATPDVGDASTGLTFHLGGALHFGAIGGVVAPFLQVTGHAYPSPLDRADKSFAVGLDLVLGLSLTAR